MKQWMKCRGLLNTKVGGISAYGVALLTIHWLQVCLPVYLVLVVICDALIDLMPYVVCFFVVLLVLLTLPSTDSWNCSYFKATIPLQDDDMSNYWF